MKKTDCFPLSNGGGDTTITTSARVQTVILDITGTARTSLIAIDVLSVRNGARLTCVVLLPATEDIVLDFKNNDIAGDSLLPDGRFPDSRYTTDGIVRRATFEFAFNEREDSWLYISASIPS